MTSRSEAGAYGDGGAEIKDWDKYNPLMIKTRPVPVEAVCALCETKREYIFPVTLELCYTCANKIMERKDIYRAYVGKMMDLSGLYCISCNNWYPTIYKISTRICQKCTYRLGQNQKRYHNILKYARKII